MPEPRQRRQRVFTETDLARLREHAKTIQLWKAAEGRKTGPTSTSGKEISGKRSTKHGMRSKSGESVERYLAGIRRLCKALAAR